MTDPTAANDALRDLAVSRDVLALYVEQAENELDLNAEIHAADRVQIDALLAEIAVLEAEIVRLLALLPTPAYEGPLIGAAYERADMMPTLEALVGRLGIRRVFSSSSPSVSHFAPDLAAGRSVAYSFKTLPADKGRAFLRTVVDALTPQQTWRKRVRKWIGRAQAEPVLTVLLTWYHEPEDNFTTDVQRLVWRTEQMAFAAAIREVVPPEVRIVQQVIFMAWSTQPESGRDLSQWATRELWDAGVRCIGWDIYQPRQSDDRKRMSFSARAELIDAFHARCDAAGFPFARTIMECGHYEVPGNPNAKAEWLYDLEEWCLDNEVGAVCYFQNANGVISVGPDYPITAAYPVTASAFRELATNYRPDHLI